MPLLPYLERVAERNNLSPEEAQEAMRVILAGQASQPQLAAFLMAMRMKGETADELVGFARAMRAMASPIDHGLSGEAVLDTCGTGGDGAGTFNISTIAAFVVAGAGVHVHVDRSRQHVHARRVDDRGAVRCRAAGFDTGDHTIRDMYVCFNRAIRSVDKASSDEQLSQVLDLEPGKGVSRECRRCRCSPHRLHLGRAPRPGG